MKTVIIPILKILYYPLFSKKRKKLGLKFINYLVFMYHKKYSLFIENAYFI